MTSAPLAQKERKQRAPREYRGAEEGHAQRRDEEIRRRERLRGVGDRSCAPELPPVETCTTAAYETAAEEPLYARDEFE